VGQGGILLSSPNGVAWQLEDSGTTNTLSAVTFANGLFIAAGDQGTVLTSNDGQSWIDRTSAATAQDLYGVGFGGGVYVAVGDKGAIITSPDGMIWTSRNSGISSQLLAVAYGNGQFIAVGPAGMILQSDSLTGPQLLLSVSYAGVTQLSVNGSTGATYQLEQSTDLQHWTTVTNLTLTSPSGQWNGGSVNSSRVGFYRVVTP
jgi:hypothetical protein